MEIIDSIKTYAGYLGVWFKALTRVAKATLIITGTAIAVIGFLLGRI